MNTDGMVSNIGEVSVNLTLNNVAQTANTGSTALPVLIANSASDGTAGTKYASGVTITPNVNKITATTFAGALDGNAKTATAFSAGQTVAITGGATGTVSSTAGWTVPITLNSKLIVGANNTAVANATSTTTNSTTYLNLYAPNSQNTNTVLSSLQLKGSGATTVSAINGAITINSTDYTTAINNAQATAINTAATDATTKASAAQSAAISTASTDATNKANAAKSAAISAAATDATTKANAAAKTVQNQAIPAQAGNEAGDTIYPLLAREGIQIMTGEETLTNKLTESYSLMNTYLTHEGYLHAAKVYGAVWNDYAEYRQTHHKVKPGQCVYEKGDGSLAISYERMMPCANIVSDTFCFAIVETDNCKTPLAVSGRVLAYPYEPKEEYKAGDAVCSGPNGTISKMTRAEIRDYPERIVGTVSEIPTYEVWGSGNVKVNGRIWIKVR